MNPTDYCIVVRLLLLPDRIVLAPGQHVPVHTFINVAELASWRLYHLVKRELTRQRGIQLEYCLLVPEDRARYTRVLDDLREQIASNVKGQNVYFDLATDPSKPLPWAIDRPQLALA